MKRLYRLCHTENGIFEHVRGMGRNEGKPLPEYTIQRAWSAR